MVLTDVARIAANSATVATAAAVGANLPWWQTPSIDLFGINIPIGSMVCAMFGLAMARGVSAAREGDQPGGHYLTGVLAAVLFALIVERQPGTGTAVAWGVGIGASGIVLYDKLRDRVLALFGKAEKGGRK